MDEKLKEICQQILRDEAESEKFMSLQTPEEMYAYFQAKIPELSEDEFDSFIVEVLDSYEDAQTNSPELVTDMLDKVSGGMSLPKLSKQLMSGALAVISLSPAAMAAGPRGRSGGGRPTSTVSRAAKPQAARPQSAKPKPQAPKPPVAKPAAAATPQVAKPTTATPQAAKPVVATTQTKSTFAKIKEWLKNHKLISIGVPLAVATAVGFGIHYLKTHKKEEKKQEPKVDPIPHTEEDEIPSDVDQGKLETLYETILGTKGTTGNPRRVPIGKILKSIGASGKNNWPTTLALAVSKIGETAKIGSRFGNLRAQLNISLQEGKTQEEKTFVAYNTSTAIGYGIFNGIRLDKNRENFKELFKKALKEDNAADALSAYQSAVTKSKEKVEKLNISNTDYKAKLKQAVSNVIATYLKEKGVTDLSDKERDALITYSVNKESRAIETKIKEYQDLKSQLIELHDEILSVINEATE